MITDRKGALRRKKEIVAEINRLREALRSDAVLVGVIPFVQERIAQLQAEFDELEHRFPSDMRHGIGMRVFVAA